MSRRKTGGWRSVMVEWIMLTAIVVGSLIVGKLIYDCGYSDGRAQAYKEITETLEADEKHKRRVNEIWQQH